MAKNTIVMSLSIKPEMEKAVRDYARKKAMNASEYIRMLIEKAIKLPIDDEPMIVGKPMGEDVLPVLLMIPGRFRGQRDALQAWMDGQTSRIVDKVGGSPQ